MADAILGSVPIPIPVGYILEPVKLETNERTLDGTLITNYAVNSQDTAMTKYHFELPGITQSLRLAIRAEALKTGNMSYTDHIQIPEVLSGSTSTTGISLLRALGTTDAGDISVTVGSSGQTVVISSGDSSGVGTVHISNSGVMRFAVSTTGTNNIIVYYPPKYTVHIVSDRHELLYKTSTTDHTVRYNLVLEEA